jgi:hypothetical protein
MASSVGLQLQTFLENRHLGSPARNGLMYMQVWASVQTELVLQLQACHNFAQASTTNTGTSTTLTTASKETGYAKNGFILLTHQRTEDQDVIIRKERDGKGDKNYRREEYRKKKHNLKK